MKPAFLALAGAALTSGACYGLGALSIQNLHLKLRRAEYCPLATVLGAAGMHLVVFALLALHLAYWPVLLALLLGIISFAIKNGAWRLPVENDPPLSKSLWLICVVLFGVFTVVYFLHALAPENSPDGSSYHLGFVARYLRHHGFERITTNMYGALSGGVEMVFVPAFAIGKHSAAALVHFSFLIALALAMLAYGRRIGKPWAGACAAFLVYASPVVGIDGSSAYIDVATAAVVFSVFYWLEIWDEDRDPRALIPVGLLCGFAYAAKYTAVVIVVYAAGFVIWRSHNSRRVSNPQALPPVAWQVATMLILAGAIMAPWMLKDWIVLQNPIAPFANEVFRNPFFHINTIEEWSSYLRSYGLPSLQTLPLEVTIRGARTQGLIGPVFLLVPVALLSLRFRAGRRLFLAGAIVLLPYFGNIGTRFLIPPLAFFALALGLAPGDSAGLAAALMLFHAVTSWPAAVKHYEQPGVWRLEAVSFKDAFKAAFRVVPEDAFLRQTTAAYGLARMIDDFVPQDHRVLSLTSLAESYTRREVLVDYQAALNNLLADILNAGWVAAYQPRVQEQLTFPERRIRRLRVEQTSTGRPLELWSVHELRFFDHGAEVPRRPDWRLSAWPNRWDVQLAFDNSPATRWRTWERARPGEYIEVDFGFDQAVDEVRIERSYDFNDLHMDVNMFDSAASRWTKIDSMLQVSPMKVDPNIRRYATYELKARDIGYILVPDDFAGAFDIRHDPEGWGLKTIAQGYGAHLYEIVVSQ